MYRSRFFKVAYNYSLSATKINLIENQTLSINFIITMYLFNNYS